MTFKLGTTLEHLEHYESDDLAAQAQEDVEFYREQLEHEEQRDYGVPDKPLEKIGVVNDEPTEPTADSDDGVAAPQDPYALPEGLIDVDYQHEKRAITWRHGSYCFKATDVELDRWGHPVCLLSVDGGSHYYGGRIDIELDRDKVAVAQALNNYKKPNSLVKRFVDSFCAGLWAASTDNLMAESMEGDITMTPPEYIVEPHIVKKAGTLLFAPPGYGKTETSLLMAVSTDAGLSDLWPTRQGRVLFVNLERSKESLKRRLGNVNRVLGLAPDRPLLTINAKGKRLADVSKIVLETLDEYEDIALIVLDSVSRAGTGSLKDDDTGNAIVDTLNSTGCAWLALAHTPRADATHIFGSVMFEAAADVMTRIYYQKQGERIAIVGLCDTKDNDTGATGNRSAFKYTYDETGLIAVSRVDPNDHPELFEDAEDTLVATGAKPWTLAGACEEVLLTAKPYQMSFPDLMNKVNSELAGKGQKVRERVTFIDALKELRDAGTADTDGKRGPGGALWWHTARGMAAGKWGE